jgi:hypothetical protein
MTFYKPFTRPELAALKALADLKSDDPRAQETLRLIATIDAALDRWINALGQITEISGAHAIAVAQLVSALVKKEMGE